MNKKEFDDIFTTCKQQLFLKSKESLHKNLPSYADANKHISPEKIATFVYMESIKYTNDMIYSLLTKVLDIAE